MLKGLISRFRLDNSGLGGASTYRDPGVKHNSNSNSTSGADKETFVEITDDAKY